MATMGGLVELTVSSAKSAGLLYFEPAVSLVRFGRELVRKFFRIMVAGAERTLFWRQAPARSFATIGTATEMQHNLEKLEENQRERLIERYLHLAEALRRRGDVERATHVLELLSSASDKIRPPAATYIWLGLGRLFFEREEWDKADWWYRRVLHESYGGDEALLANAYFNLGMTCYHRREFRDAVRFLEEAIRISEKLGAHGRLVQDRKDPAPQNPG